MVKEQYLSAMTEIRSLIWSKIEKPNRLEMSKEHGIARHIRRDRMQDEEDSARCGFCKEQSHRAIWSSMNQLESR